MSEFSVHRPVTVVMICLGLIVLGVIAIQKTRIQFMPEMKVSEFTIVTQFPGATPEEVETQVTTLIERSVATISGLINSKSVTTRERSEVKLKFRDDIDFLETMGILREKVDSAGISEGALKPKIVRYQPNANPILKAVFVPTNLNGMKVLSEKIGSTLLKEIEALPGVAVAQISGAPTKQVSVVLNPVAVLSYGLNLSQIGAVLQSKNKFFSAGEIETSGQKISVKVGENLTTVTDLENLVVFRDQGRSIRLADIATLKIEEISSEYKTKINGKPGLLLEVKKEAEANAISVSEALKNSIETFAKANGADVKATITYDEGVEIKKSVDGVIDAVFNGGALTAIAIYLFMQSFWSTFVVSLIIPLALLLTLIMMYFTGITYNLMSLSGLALGVGMLVDNAIVVLNNIQYYNGIMDDPKEAAIWGTKKVTGAIVSSTLSNIAVFGPLAMVEGTIGQMFKDICLTIVYSNLAALVLAILVVPMLCGLQFRSSLNNLTFKEQLMDLISGTRARSGVALAEGFFSIYGLCFEFGFKVVGIFLGQLIKKLLGFFRIVIDQAKKYFFDPLQTHVNKVLYFIESSFGRVLPKVISKPVGISISSLLFLIASVFLFSNLGTELFPDSGNTRFVYDLEFESGLKIEENERRTDEIVARLLKQEGVEFVSTSLGGNGSNTSRLEIKTNESISEWFNKYVVEKLQEVAGLEFIRVRENATNTEKPVQLEIYDEDLVQLEKNTKKLTSEISRLQYLREVDSSLKAKIPEVNIELNRQMVDDSGLDVSALLSNLKILMSESAIGTLGLKGEELKIKLSGPKQYFSNLDRILFFPQAVDEKKMYLTQVSKVQQRNVVGRIDHSDRKRVAIVSAALKNIDLGTAIKSITSEIKSKSEFKNLNWKFGGQREEQEKSQKSLTIAIMLSIFLVYLILASQFENFVQPLVILFSVPLCVIGVATILYLCGFNISSMVLVGFVILVGSSVNSAIVMVDGANQLVANGVPVTEAIVKTTINRLRPILMSVLSGVIGLLPLALKLGEGSSLQQPLALTVIGGLISSTVFSLLLIPILFKFTAKKTNEVSLSNEESKAIAS